MAVSTCLVSFVPAPCATQALYNCGSCRSGHILPVLWKRTRVCKQPLSTTLRRKALREATPRCCATLPESDQPYLNDLQVPEAWLHPSVAAQEAEWLRGALHQWLDDEYCPEPANEEISRRCSKVYYYCLMEQQVDIGDILMQMVRDLETFSFKESFHGTFSSANAAIALITKRMEEMPTS
ncbi:hypothetical protein KC19_5G021100 [Ceratodon purpureus]|uniref:Uncharacterized protein n=1 Tax=Ceratodon purpureus TaxID=3225 RepID=A0A8T0HY03_CERPU|nr:hypothetical protein KC19_5G021100 [Ceratodon purpureus]